MRTFLSFIGLLFFPLSLLASPTNPVFVKTQDSGYTLPEHYQTFTCRVFLDHVETERHQAVPSTPIYSSRPLYVSSEVLTVLKQAKNESFMTGPSLCDAPSTLIFAYLGETETDVLDLYRKSTCSARDGQRQGKNSEILIRYINEVCGQL